MFEAKAPRKMMRKVRWDRAARAVPVRAGTGESPSTTASSISSMEMVPSSRSGRELSDAGGTGPSYGRPSRARPGSGASWLEDWKTRRGTGADNLVPSDFQPYGDLPAADVLVAILEPEASRFSVPSKVLTYLCSGRASACSPRTTPSPSLARCGAGSRTS